MQSLLLRTDVQVAISAGLVFGAQHLNPPWDAMWWKAMKKPQYTPPVPVFPLVWVPLKIMQTAAVSIVVRSAVLSHMQPSAGVAALALCMFTTQMALGNKWKWELFGDHRPGSSLKWVMAMWAMVAGTAAVFQSIDPLAGALILPTLAWLTFITKFNADVAQLNEDAPGAVAQGNKVHAL